MSQRSQRRSHPRPHGLVLALTALALFLPSASAFALPRALSVSPRAAIPLPETKPPALPPGTILGGSNWACREVGACAPCPAAQRASSPVCQFYGNRRPLSCVPLHSSPQPNSHLAATNANAGGGSADLLAQAGGGGDNAADDFTIAPPSRPKRPSTPQKAGAKGALKGEDEEVSDLDEALLREEWLVGEDREEERIMVPGERWRRAEEGLWSRAEEVRTWEACGKVVQVERKDFFEFVMCNLFFAVASVGVLSYRYRHLASRQYGTLVARLGVSMS